MPTPVTRQRVRIRLGYLLVAWWRGQLYRDEQGRWCVRDEHLEAIRRDWEYGECPADRPEIPMPKAPPPYAQGDYPGTRPQLPRPPPPPRGDFPARTEAPPPPPPKRHQQPPPVAPDRTPADFKRGTYRHYKGDLYTAIGLVTHHETRLPMVLYVSHAKGCVNCRPLHGYAGDRDGFCDPILLDGREVERFELMQEGKP